MLHVLDDFAFCAGSEQECKASLQTFSNLCKEIRVPLAKEKTEGPIQVMTYLGIELDARNQVARLPADKITKCLESIFM